MREKDENDQEFKLSKEAGGNLKPHLLVSQMV
jgi:hypothetical protein